MPAAGTVLSGENPLLISPLSLFLLQTCVVVCTSRLLAVGLKWVNQPQVMAEILGGIVLGATALSRITAFKNSLFPEASLPLMKLVADLGLVLYLFLVGLELDPVHLLKIFKKSVSISVAGIVLPFALGAGVSKVIYDNYADPSVSFVSFLLFTGVAMSITAFPVLARILTERKLLHTKVGQATISAAAVDDFIAWTLLVLVIALINNSGSGGGNASSYATAVYVFLCVVAWALFLWFAVRPLILRMVKLAEDREHLQQVLLFTVFTLVLFSGWFTEIIGVQAIFGGFLVGVIIPHEHGFARKIAHQIEDLVTIVFLPLFFAYSGLNTDLTLLRDGKSWMFVALICFVACAGKMLGCTLTARISGLDWRESSTVGILMNTRGLVQIIVLNVGLNAGVITPQIFSMFVLMAVFTTFLTVPLVSVVYPTSYYLGESESSDLEGVQRADESAVVQDESQLRVLVCLPSMNVVSPMMTLCTMISGSTYLTSFSVYALRLIKSDSRMSTVMRVAEQDLTVTLDPILNVFRTFSTLHGWTSFPLLEYTEPSAVSDAVVRAAKHAGAGLVLIPQSASNTTSDAPSTPTHYAATSPAKLQSSWIGETGTQAMCRVVAEVGAQLPGATVVHFLDRGFMALNSREGISGVGSQASVSAQSSLQNVFGERPGSAGSAGLVPEQASLRPSVGTARLKLPRLNLGSSGASMGASVGGGSAVGNRIVVVLVVAGVADTSEAEAVRFVRNLTDTQPTACSVVFETHVVKLGWSKAAKSSDTIASAGDEESAGKLLTGATSIQLDTDDVTVVTDRLGILVRNREDLVVIGENVFKVGFAIADPSVQEHLAAVAPHDFSNLERWLHYGCAASVAFVHGHK
ncbi:Sodium/hydrogen exchanger family-domain-containing protein [Chytriomyces sp. MP71]|nr:Sodium/hydrogen exchanger family-domain-containing protein [Chytriomyces sp. MP71]